MTNVMVYKNIIVSLCYKMHKIQEWKK